LTLLFTIAGCTGSLPSTITCAVSRFIYAIFVCKWHIPVYSNVLLTTYTSPLIITGNAPPPPKLPGHIPQFRRSLHLTDALLSTFHLRIYRWVVSLCESTAPERRSSFQKKNRNGVTAVRYGCTRRSAAFVVSFSRKRCAK